MKTEYLILITEESKPVLVEVPQKAEKTISFLENPPKDITEDFHRIMVQNAISDESKHIRFKDDFEAWKTLVKAGYFQEGRTMAESVGQTFPLPTGYKVSFEYIDPIGNTSSVPLCDSQTVAILSKLEEEKKECTQDVFTIDRKHEGDKCIITVYKNGELVKQERKPLETWEVRCVAPSEEVKQNPLLRIRQCFYSKDTDDIILKEIDEILTESGFPFLNEE